MKTQIVYFEGLNPLLILPMGATYIQNGLIKDLKGDFEAHRYAWFNSGPTKLAEGKIILIAHSMGMKAAIDWANRYDKEISLMVGLDGRPFGRPYIKPKCVVDAHNFFRDHWWMRGYPLEDAMNYITIFGHSEVPSHPTVRYLVQKEIYENSKS